MRLTRLCNINLHRSHIGKQDILNMLIENQYEMYLNPFLVEDGYNTPQVDG